MSNEATDDLRRKAQNEQTCIALNDALCQVTKERDALRAELAKVRDQNAAIADEQARNLDYKVMYRELEAELAAIQAQEPVAEVGAMGYGAKYVRPLAGAELPEVGAKLYASPQPLAKQVSVPMVEIAALLKNWEDLKDGESPNVDAVRRFVALLATPSMEV